MRLKEIKAIGLFGIFDHVIPLKMDDRLTIIHGPNGFGKTTILRMIHSLNKGDYAIFRQVPFNVFSLEFDNNSNITITKSTKKAGGKKEAKILKIQCKATNGKSHSFEIREDKYPAHDRYSYPPYALRATERKLLAQYGGPEYDDAREAILFDLRRHYFARHSPEKEPEQIREVREGFEVRFLDAERLISEPEEEEEEEEKARIPRTVSKYSKELVNTVRSTIEDYASLSQSLDRSFPIRLVQEHAPSILDEETLSQRLNELENKRLRLVEAGLLGREPGEFEMPTEITEDKKAALSVYVEDGGKKLALFDYLANKLDILQKIINRRFMYKKLTIDRNKGFVLTTNKNEPLAPTDLSSGEQHELVLHYDLLFKAKPNTLFLIDEPELSLHVDWQTKIITDLQDIAKLSLFDIILATHSPQIIHDRWDLTVGLKGPTD